MKRIIKVMSLLLLFAISLTVFPTTANADMLPMLPGSFFENHLNELDYENRTYFVDSNNGEIKTYDSPLNARVTGSIKNGEEVYVAYTYEKNNVLWGGNSSGWFAMDNLGLIYDSKQFSLDNADKIRDYDCGDLEELTVMLYTYPNSGTFEKIKGDAEYGLFSKSMGYAYTDENGKDWGKVGYYMGRRDGWICIQDPQNDTLSNGEMQPIPSIAKQRGYDTEIKGDTTLLLASLAVGVIAIVSVVLIVKTKKKK